MRRPGPINSYSPPALAFLARVGFHPMALAGPWGKMFSDMKNKTWLVEVELAACLMAVAAVAFTLMMGHTLWLGLARK
jgi:hypothetical protein